MPILTKLKQFLDANHVSYEVLSHRPAYTAQEVAAAQHVPGREMAKVVIAKCREDFVMVVLPAPRMLDPGKLGHTTGAACRLATEEEFAGLFPQCDPGAMPPFGNLFGLTVYADRQLAKDERIVFQAGTHTETVRMAYADFAHLVRPIVGDFSFAAAA